MKLWQPKLKIIRNLSLLLLSEKSPRIAKTFTESKVNLEGTVEEGDDYQQQLTEAWGL